MQQLAARQPDRSFTAAEVEAFRRDGYVVRERFFDAREVAALRADLARLVGEGRLANLLDAGAPGAVNLQLCPMGPHSRLVTAMRRHPRLVAAVRELLGDPVVFVLDQVFLKPAGRGAGTDWHQDNAYFQGDDPTAGVGVWTSLQDATVENGTMHVVPRSHLVAAPHGRDARSGALIRATVDDRDAVAIPLPAGGAIFFNFGVLHCTKDNRSAHDRAGLALHFANARYQSSWGGEEREVLSGPGCVEGAGNDAWLAEVDRALASPTG